jgi:hypothetical protein
MRYNPILGLGSEAIRMARLNWKYLRNHPTFMAENVQYMVFHSESDSKYLKILRDNIDTTHDLTEFNMLTYFIWCLYNNKKIIKEVILLTKIDKKPVIEMDIDDLLDSI